jgi:periplasmic protein CpxP/Spy
MKARMAKAAIAVLSVTLLAAAALAQTPSSEAPSSQPQAPHHFRRAGMWGGGPGMGFFGRRLGLTDDQKAQVKDIMTKERPTLRPLMQQLAQSRMQLEQYQASGNFDEAQVRAMAAQQAQIMTELTVQKARIQSEMIKVLTPDQKSKLAEMQSARQQRFQQRLQKAPAAPSDSQQ